MKEYIIRIPEENAESIIKGEYIGEIVRCKDCEWWGAEGFCENSDSPCFQNGCVNGNWFCADGMEKVKDDV